MFQIKVDGVQEKISRPLRKPQEYSPVYVFTTKLKHNGDLYGKATISDLVLVPNAKGYIVDEDDGIVDKNIGGGNNDVNIGKEIVVLGPQGSPSKLD